MFKTAAKTDICHLLPFEVNERGTQKKHSGQKAILTTDPQCLQTERGRVTGETQDEWIAAVDLSFSFRVLSYSVAATPVGGRRETGS